MARRLGDGVGFTSSSVARPTGRRERRHRLLRAYRGAAPSITPLPRMTVMLGIALTESQKVRAGVRITRRRWVFLDWRWRRGSLGLIRRTGGPAGDGPASLAACHLDPDSWGCCCSSCSGARRWTRPASAGIHRGVQRLRAQAVLLGRVTADHEGGREPKWLRTSITMADYSAPGATTRPTTGEWIAAMTAEVREVRRRVRHGLGRTASPGLLRALRPRQLGAGDLARCKVFPDRLASRSRATRR